MTRVRVLLLAKKLLQSSCKYHKVGDILGAATTQDNQVVTYRHPKAKNYTLMGAIQRAVFELTCEEYTVRDDLFRVSTDPLIKRAGGMGAFRNFLTTAPVEKVIELLKEQLTEWDEK